MVRRNAGGRVLLQDLHVAARRLALVRVGHPAHGRQRASAGRPGPRPLRQAQRVLRRARGGRGAGRARRLPRGGPGGGAGDPRRRPAGARGKPARGPPPARGQARIRLGRELRGGARGRGRGDRAQPDHRLRLLRARLRRGPRTAHRPSSPAPAPRPPRAALADPGSPGGARDGGDGAAARLREQRPAGDHARERRRRLRQPLRGSPGAPRGGVRQQRRRVASRARSRGREDRGGGDRGRAAAVRGAARGPGRSRRDPGACRARGGGHEGPRGAPAGTRDPARRKRRGRLRLRPSRGVRGVEPEPPPARAVRGAAAVRRDEGLLSARPAGAGGGRGGGVPRHVPPGRVRARGRAGGPRGGPRGRFPGCRGHLRPDHRRRGFDRFGPDMGGPFAPPAAAPRLRRLPERHDRRRPRPRGARRVRVHRAHQAIHPARIRHRPGQDRQRERHGDRGGGARPFARGGRHDDLPAALRPGRVRGGGGSCHRRVPRPPPGDPHARVARGGGGGVRAGGAVAAPLVLPEAGRGPARGGEPRVPRGARGSGALRRVHPRQDRHPGSGCGRLSRSHLHQRLVQPRRRTVPLRPHARRGRHGDGRRGHRAPSASTTS